MKYLILLCALIGWMPIHAQLVHNGGLEDWDYSVPNASNDTFGQFINHAQYWQILQPTPDVFHPVNGLAVPADAHGGGAYGRFAAVPGSAQSEWSYTTTEPLTAGQTYEVSFWVRKDQGTSNDASVGLGLATIQPQMTNSATPNIPALMTAVPTNNLNYVQLRACFTPEASGVHYVVIGPYGGASPDHEINVYYFDDVSITELPDDYAFPNAEISMTQTSFCVGDQVLVDGSASTNQTQYSWEIIYGNDPIYNSGIQTGNPGTFDATPHLAFLAPGNCYTVRLIVYDLCRSITEQQFCFVDPSIDFLYDGAAVCQGEPVDLVVTGDDGWHYTWTNGGTVLADEDGKKELIVTPVVGNSIYTVTVLTPEGCIGHKTIALNVNYADNAAPTMDGINHWGEYTYYVKQGETVNFTSTLSNDHGNEEMELSRTYNIPLPFDFSLPTQWGENLTLNWQTAPFTPTGEYFFTLTANDHNACDPKTGTFNFRIIVVCDQCPICIDYENRTPSGTPLPPETKAGQCIRAGLTEPVSMDNSHVLFQAGDFIDLGDFFEAGPGWEGLIEPTTCITDCEDCCANWEGFTMDQLPDYFYVDFGDDNPTNDFVQITDTYHPFCAYNAFGYEWLVFDNEGHQLNSNTGEQNSSCCSFESPAPENPIPHASIWWDGYFTNMWGNYVHATDGVYFYRLTLHGCDGTTTEWDGDIYVFGNDQFGFGMAQAGDSTTASAMSTQELASMQTVTEERQSLDKAVTVKPNPTSSFVTISGTERDATYFQLFDDKGNMLSHKQKAVDQTVDLTNYSAGTYYLRIYSGSTYVTRKIVKI